MAIRFSLGARSDSDLGWGPSRCELTARDVPYSAFERTQKQIGAVADWYTTRGEDGRVDERNGNVRVRRPTAAPAGAASAGPDPAAPDTVFAYQHRVDDKSFSLVNTQTKAKSGGRFGIQRMSSNRGAGFPGRGGRRNSQAPAMPRGTAVSQPPRKRAGLRWGRRPPRRDWDQEARTYDASVRVNEEWPILHEWALDTLGAAGKTPSEPAEDLIWAGSIDEYNTVYDRVTTKAERPLRRFETLEYFTTTTSLDPVIERLANEAPEDDILRIFATDTILALLMAAPRTVNSWDIIIRKLGNKIFLDKRPMSRIDYMTINQNTHATALAAVQGSPEEELYTSPDGCNNQLSLSTEATFINHNFSQQTLKKETRIALGEPNPFLESIPDDMKAASVGYRYRKWYWPAAEGIPPIQLVARCEINAYLTKRGESKEQIYLSIKALNDVLNAKLSGGAEYRRKLDSQRAFILATEFKNNPSKITRWIAQALLAGVDEMRVGFVARVLPNDSMQHAILGCQRYKPAAFASQVSIKPSMLWASLHEQLTQFALLADGTYLVLKDPNLSSLRLLSIPADAFDDEDADFD